MQQKTLRTIIKHSLFEKRMQSYLVVSAGTGLTAAVTCGYIPYTSLVLYIPIQYGMLLGISKIYGFNFPLKFISAYIKQNFGYLEINNETLSDAINPNDTSDRYNSEYDANKSSRDIHYYSESYYDEFQKNYNKKDEDINKLIGIISPIGIKSQSFVNELYINQISRYLADFSAEVIKEIINSVTWIITAHGNPAIGIMAASSTAMLGKNYMGFVKKLYLKRNIKFSDIKIEDIKKHINSTRK